MFGSCLPSGRLSGAMKRFKFGHRDYSDAESQIASPCTHCHVAACSYSPVVAPCVTISDNTTRTLPSVPLTDHSSQDNATHHVEPERSSAASADSDRGSKHMVACYELRRTLGKGASGKVKVGLDTRTGEAVAVKIMYRDCMTARQEVQLNREITAMKTVTHPNVLRLRDVYLQVPYTKKDGQQRLVAILVLDLAMGGQLFEFMRYTGAFPENVARTYFKQLLGALQTCHSAGIMHRDIKPENLLLDGEFQLKVADFGLSFILDGPRSVCSTACGTSAYMAPELLARQPYDGRMADLWSAGVVLFIMLAGNPPFHKIRRTDAYFKAVNEGRYADFWAWHGRRSPDFPEAAKLLLNRIFVPDPARRASLQDLLDDPWMQGEVRDRKQLFMELWQRKLTVDGAKASERQANLEARRAKRGRSDIDPYAMMVQRNVSGLAETVVAPNLPQDGPPELNVLYSWEPAGVLLSRIAEALRELPDNAEVTTKKETVKVKATFASGLEVLVRVYANRLAGLSPSGGSSSSKGGSKPKQDSGAAYHVIEVSRRAGDMVDFAQAHAKLAEALSDVVSSAEDLPAGPLDTFATNLSAVFATSATSVVRAPTLGQESSEIPSLAIAQKPFMGLLPPPMAEDVEHLSGQGTQSNGYALPAGAVETQLAATLSQIDLM